MKGSKNCGTAGSKQAYTEKNAETGRHTVYGFVRRLYRRSSISKGAKRRIVCLQLDGTLCNFLELESQNPSCRKRLGDLTLQDSAFHVVLRLGGA